MDNSFEQVIKQLPPWFREIADSVPLAEQERITELRLFLDKAPIWMQNRTCKVFHQGVLSRKQLDEIFYAICRGSVHSFQREIAEGFVTMVGGHRVGLCGTAVFFDEKAGGLRDITSMNIRFAKERRGCAEELFAELRRLGLEQGNFLLAGAPGSGKTTLLRDYARLLAESGIVTAILDERGEFSGFDLGHSCHVLKHLPKEKAILQAVRTLSPQVILCDEIGSHQEAKLLCEGLNSGCHFIASIHGEKPEQLFLKPQLQPLLQQRALDAVIFLEPLGKRKAIITKEDFHAFTGLRNDISLRSVGRLASSSEIGGYGAAMAGTAALFPTDSGRTAEQSATQRRDPAECVGAM